MYVQFIYIYIGSLCQYIILITLLVRIPLEDGKLLSSEDEKQTKSLGCPICTAGA